MHSRVKPLETGRQKPVHDYAQEEQENPSSALQEATQSTSNGDEEQLEALTAIYRPILTLMKLCGMYFGETMFKRMGQNASAPGSRKNLYISRIYCCAIVAGFWFIVMMGFVSLCVEDPSFLHNFYTIITFTMWYSAASLVATTCLLVLPLTEKKESRFKRFLQILVERSLDLANVKSYSRKGVVIVVFVLLTSTVTMIAAQQMMPELSVAYFKPWNRWYGFRVLAAGFQFFSLSVWLLPILFFCLTCLILERQFDCYCQRVSSSQNSNSLDLTALKDEHQTLCKTVELAEKIFSPLLLEIVSIYIPLLCFNFYIAINPPSSSEGNSVLFSIMCSAYWLLGSFLILCIITVFGSRVNEKVRNKNGFTSV